MSEIVSEKFSTWFKASEGVTKGFTFLHVFEVKILQQKHHTIV